MDTRGSFPGGGGKVAGACEADHLPLSNVEVRNTWSYTSSPPVRLNGVMLSYKYRYYFTFIVFKYQFVGPVNKFCSGSYS
jgi:hypothetical protein